MHCDLKKLVTQVYGSLGQSLRGFQKRRARQPSIPRAANIVSRVFRRDLGDLIKAQMLPILSLFGSYSSNSRTWENSLVLTPAYPDLGGLSGLAARVQVLIVLTLVILVLFDPIVLILCWSSSCCWFFQTDSDPDPGDSGPGYSGSVLALGLTILAVTLLFWSRYSASAALNVLASKSRRSILRVPVLGRLGLNDPSFNPVPVKYSVQILQTP